MRKAVNLKPFNETLGKLPPQAVDIEQAILGSLMMDKTIVDEITGLMKPEFFYKESNQIIFRAIQQMILRSEPIDILTLTSFLKTSGELENIGGPYYITELTSRVSSSSNIEHHCRIVTQKFLQREIIRNSNDLMKKCYDDSCDVFEVISELDAICTSLNQNIIGKDYESDFASDVEEVYNEVFVDTQIGIHGIKTGNYKLDHVTGGFNEPDLILLCARPGQGKSTRMLGFLKEAVNAGKHCAVFSIEMSKKQLIKKQLIEFSDVFAWKIMKNTMDEKDIENIKFAKEKLKKLPIYLNQKSGVTPMYIKKVCTERKKKYGLDMIFIDYLQLMKPNENIKGRSREQEVADISMSLKGLAKDLKVPVMALCQLNRDLEKRTDKRPQKSDLRDSGQLEQDADLIMGLYRPSQYYEIGKDKDYKNSGMSEDDYNMVSELHIMKNRHGQSEVFFEERFIGELSRFVCDNLVYQQEPVVEIQRISKPRSQEAEQEEINF